MQQNLIFVGVFFFRDNNGVEYFTENWRFFVLKLLTSMSSVLMFPIKWLKDNLEFLTYLVSAEVSLARLRGKGVGFVNKKLKENSGPVHIFP